MAGRCQEDFQEGVRKMITEFGFREIQEGFRKAGPEDVYTFFHYDITSNRTLKLKYVVEGSLRILCVLESFPGRVQEGFRKFQEDVQAPVQEEGADSSCTANRVSINV